MWVGTVGSVGRVALGRWESPQLSRNYRHCRRRLFRVERRGFFQMSLDKRREEGGKPWRTSASLLLVAPLNEAPPFSLGYLMLERSKGSRVNPGGTVFPGGAVSPVDFSLDTWAPLFQTHGGGVDLRSLAFLRSSAHVPPIYHDEAQSPQEGRLSPEIGFRLTAIRETFEETGVLLGRRGGGGGEELGVVMGGVLEWGQKEEVASWQKRILKNPQDFAVLFEELRAVPDLWGLWEWTNWLTPTVFKAKSRFDVMFFMSVVRGMPRVRTDKHEVASAQWAQPSSLLKEDAEGSLRLMPPQHYEMSRLQRLTTVEQLQAAMEERRTKGLERFFPVIRTAEDGTLFLLPGDDLYPQTPDYETFSRAGEHKLPGTLEELNRSGVNFHRHWVPREKGVEGGWRLNVARYGHSY